MGQKVITPELAWCAICSVPAKPEEDWNFRGTWRIICFNHKHSTKYCGTVHRATCRWNNMQARLIANDFIGPGIQGRDRQLLKAFYEGRMANPHGGTAHEMNLGGLHAVLAFAAADRPVAVAPEAPRRPRYTRHYADGSWQGADHPGGPWRPIPAPQQGLPWRTDGPTAVAPEATGQPLSPVAQAVRAAANGASSFEPGDWLNDAREIATAVIRALADHAGSSTPWRISELRGLAAELERADG